jgi:hypothetical protein
MTLRRFLFLLFACFALGPPLHAQNVQKAFVLTAANQCASIVTAGQATVGIQVSGTWSATLQPQVSIGGGTATNTTTTPIGSSTAQNTITANGVFTSSVAGMDNFYLCVSAYTSGSINVVIAISTTINAQLFGGGGGGGSGTVTSVASGPGLTGGPITGSGTLSLVSPVAVANGGTGTTSTLAGLVRGGNPFSASELSGDCTTSGSNAVTCTPFARLAGATFTGEVITAASASGGAGFNLPPGAAPSAPNNGDCWTTTAGLFCWINGSSVGPFVATGFANPLTTLGDIFVGGTSGAPTRLAGPTGVNGVVQVPTSTPSGGVATQVAWSPMGVATRASACTSNLDTVLATDRAGYVSWSDASACAVTLPQAGTTGFASNFVFVGCDIGAGTATITPTTSTISYTNGSTYTSAATSLALTTGQCAYIYTDNTNYFAILPGGSVAAPLSLTTGTNSASVPLTITQGAISTNFPAAALNISQGANTGATNVPIINATGTWNNASIAGPAYNFAITNTSSAAGAVLMNWAAGAGGVTSEMSLLSGGTLNVGTTVKTGTYGGSAAITNVCGGSCAVGTAGIASAVFNQGSDNSSNSAAAGAGFGIFRGGMLTNATPNAAALEGVTQLESGALKGTAVANLGDVVCATTTAYTVTDCPISGGGTISGIATSTANPIGYVHNGQALVKLDGALTAIGDWVGMGTTTAGLAHDYGTTGCPNTVNCIGVIIADSGSPITATGATSGATAMSTTLPLVQLAIASPSTLATPGAIGGTTPSTGAFTTIAASGSVTIGTANCTTFGTAGGLCATEGTAPTNVASTAALYPDSTAHELLVATNGSTSFGQLVRAQPGAINQTAKTAAITTATLCAASAGACNVAGEYHVHWNFWGSGTACSSVTAGSVTFLLTWTDENATAHSAVAEQMVAQTGAATTAMQSSFPFQTALANESASGDVTISTNGSVIQYGTGYTACTTGTGAYGLRATVTRIQ